MLGVYLTKKIWISLRVHDECMIKKHSNYARWPRKMITYACDHRMSSNPSLAAKTDHIASAGRTTGCPEVSGRLEEQIPLFSLGCSAADKKHHSRNPDEKKPYVHGLNWSKKNFDMGFS